MRRSSGTQPMPMPAISCVGARVTSRPSKRMRAAPRRRQAEDRAQRASSCRRRSGRAARPPRRGRRRARRRTAPASRRRRSRRSVEREHHAALPGSSAAPTGSRAARPACRRRSPGPSGSPRRVSARPNRKRMSCSMMTIVSWRFSSRDQVGEPRGAFAAEAGGRLVEEQQARLGGERDGDLERAPLAVREARAPARAPCRRGRRARAPPPPAARRPSRRAGRARRRKPLPAHARQRDQHVVERASRRRTGS